jgi:hypothetical protein
MPLEEQVGSVANAPTAVEEADAGRSEWKKITADARRVPPGATLHTMMAPGGGWPINLGWAIPNRFSALGKPQDTAEPSKVADNV